MFVGFVNEGQSATIFVDTATADGVPVAPDAAPTFRVFGQSGPVSPAVGTATVAESGTVSDATNTSPVTVTADAHGLADGATVVVAGVVGNAGANGTFAVAVTGANSFTLVGSTGTGAYGGGGSWVTVGLWKVELEGVAVAGLEAGRTYTLVLSWAVAAARRVRTYTLSVQ